MVFCANETIEGVEFKSDPLIEGKTLIADVSSNFMSKPINIANYGIIYGGVQKNIGPAGMALVIIRDDLLNTARYAPPHPQIPTTNRCHHPIWSRRRYYSTQCTDISQPTGAHHPIYLPGGGTTAHSILTPHNTPVPTTP